MKKKAMIEALRKTRPRTCGLFGKSRTFQDKTKKIARKQKHKNQGL